MKEKIKKISLYEEQIYGETEVPEASKNFILFQLGEESYGIHDHFVREVLPMAPISALPSVPPHLMGVMNLRGEVVSVTNLKKVLNLENRPSDGKTRIVVIESGDLVTGLYTDGAEETVTMPISKVQPVISTLQDKKHDFIEGQVKWKDKLIAILNVPKILKRTKL